MSNLTNNPYLLAIELLDARTYIRRDEELIAQLMALSVLFGIIFILLCISMIARWKLGTFWLIRTVTTKNGTFLVPHATVSWSLFSAIAALEIQGFIQSIRSHSDIGSNLNNSMLWRCLAWTPYFIAAWFLTWATSTSPILSRSPNAVTSKYNPTKYPIVVNIFFVAVPILVVAIILPLSCIATQGTNEVWYMTVELRNRLSMDAEAFESGNMTGLIDPRNMLEDFHVACIPIWQETVKNVQKVWWSWSIFTAFLFTTYVVSGIFHLRTLNKSISRLQTQQVTKSGSYAEKMNSLTWAYRSLCFTAILTLLIDGIFFAFSLILSIKTEDTFFGRNSLAAVVELGCFWCFCSLGLVSTIAILLRSFVSPPTSTTTSISLRNPTSRAAHSLSGITSHTSHNMDPTVTFKSFSSNNTDWDNRNAFKNTDLSSVKVEQKVEVQYEGYEENFADFELDRIGRSPSAFDLEFTKPKIVKRYE